MSNIIVVKTMLPGHFRTIICWTWTIISFYLCTHSLCLVAVCQLVLKSWLI